MVNAPWFKPWIGNEYEDGFNKVKLMILGESHYLSPICDGGQDSTIDLIKKHATNKLNHAFFTNVLTMVNGEKLDAHEREDLWNKVIFYNYIQSPLQKARMCPTGKMWYEAYKPFCFVVAKYKPQCIIVLGQRLWGGIPIDEERTKKYYSGAIKRVPFKGGQAIMSWVIHPSSFGPNRVQQQKRVKRLLQLARKA